MYSPEGPTALLRGAVGVLWDVLFGVVEVGSDRSARRPHYQPAVPAVLDMPSQEQRPLGVQTAVEEIAELLPNCCAGEHSFPQVCHGLFLSNATQRPVRRPSTGSGNSRRINLFQRPPCCHTWVGFQSVLAIFTQKGNSYSLLAASSLAAIQSLLALDGEEQWSPTLVICALRRRSLC